MKAQSQSIKFVESFDMDAPKTKDFKKILSAIGADGRKVLFVMPEDRINVYLSSRNLPDVNVVTPDFLNTYNIMNANSLVFVDGVQDALAGSNS